MRIVTTILMALAILVFLGMGLYSLSASKTTVDLILGFMCLGFSALIFGQGAIVTANYKSKGN